MSNTLDHIDVGLLLHVFTDDSFDLKSRDDGWAFAFFCDVAKLRRETIAQIGNFATGKLFIGAGSVDDTKRIEDRASSLREADHGGC